MRAAINFGVPLRPTEIPYDLEPIEEGDRYDPQIPDAEARFVAVAADWIEECYGEHAPFRWKDGWRNAPTEALARAFTKNELYRLWKTSFLASDLGDHIEANEHLLWKIDNCLWRYGPGKGWNGLVRAVAGLKRLDLGLADFDLKLTHSRYTNEFGRSAHNFDLWLDAALGLIVEYKGEHVLTVGFACWGDGDVLITQVQLKKRKGNRFLYKLGRHYLDVVLDMFTRAFGDDHVYLVTGKSAVAAVRAAYGKAPCGMTPEDEARIAAIYDRTLDAYDRVEGDSYECYGRRYLRLRRREAASRAA